MDQKDIQEAIRIVNCALDLKRKPVGVRFLFDADQFEQAGAAPLTTKMPYCVMVKRAMRGYSVKAMYENFGCLASARALGITAPSELFMSGRHYRRLGLYQDLVTCKQVRQQMTICQHRAFGVTVKPLEAFRQNPDIVLIVANPYNAMRIIQAYTHIHGCHTAFKMSGNQAICSECTAFPFESNAINVSMLCSGTRFMGGWRDDELAIGFAFNKFSAIVKGICATLNLTEPDRKKTEIEFRLRQAQREDVQIRYGHNYYTSLYLTQKEGREPSETAVEKRCGP